MWTTIGDSKRHHYLVKNFMMSDKESQNENMECQKSIQNEIIQILHSHIKNKMLSLFKVAKYVLNII